MRKLDGIWLNGWGDSLLKIWKNKGWIVKKYINKFWKKIK